MTKAEYFEFHEACCEKMRAITMAKNADYTGESVDPFANFTRSEALGITSTERGFLTRMVDKIARLISFADRGILQVKDESVEDTLLDLANYCILMAGYIQSKRPQKNDLSHYGPQPGGWEFNYGGQTTHRANVRAP